MDEDIKELVKRLRVHFRSVNASGLPCMTPRNPDGEEAAHALEALAGEVARLTSDVDALGENLEKVVAERDRLKSALLDIKHFGAGFAQDRARKALGDAS